MYYAIVTDIGKAKIAEAVQTGTRINLNRIVLGDGNGKEVTPVATQTTLVHQVHTANITSYSRNGNVIEVKACVNASTGGFTVREGGLLDTEGNLIAVCSFPATYKDNGSVMSELDIAIRIAVENADTVDFTLCATYDSALSNTSANAVQNKVVAAEIRTLDDRIDEVSNSLDDISNSLGGEIANRSSADTALGRCIDTEITNRQAADTALSNRINSRNVYFAVCNTAGSEQCKKIYIDGYNYSEKVSTGDLFLVMFTNDNEYNLDGSSNVTMSVNDTGSYDIYSGFGATETYTEPLPFANGKLYAFLCNGDSFTLLKPDNAI